MSLWTRFSCATERLARKATIYSGHPIAFVSSVLLIVGWACLGPYYSWSDSHSLFINTATTIITYLMVFLIQRTQNKDSFAIQMKLNELLAAHHGASNRLINIEDLNEDDILKLHQRYKRLAERSRGDDSHTVGHTVEEIDDD